MSTDRRQFRYGPHRHVPQALIFCAGCETFAVLRQVEGFHEELAEIGKDADRKGTWTPTASDQIVAAVEGAALRGFRMGIELAMRCPIGKERMAEIEKQSAGFLA